MEQVQEKLMQALHPTVRGHFRFLAGEFSLATWKPLLLLAPLAEGGAPPAIPSPAGLVSQINALVPQGYLLRRQPVDRWPLGISKLGSWLCYVPRRERLYLVNFQGTFEEYLGKHSAKSRHNLKRAVKKLRESTSGPLLRIFSTSGEMAEFQKLAGEISRHTYQEKLLNAGLPRSADYLRQMEEKAARGEARGYLLHGAEKPIAYAWCSARGTSISYEIIGFLPEYAPLSPGTVLLYLIVQDLFELGAFSELDFGVGDSEYKRLFSTHSIDFVDAHLFPRTIRNSLLVHTHWNLDRLNSKLGAILERYGIKNQVRRLLRRLRSA
jgi:hypothetical protein